MTDTDKYSFAGALGNLIRHSLKILAEENVPGAVSGIHNYKVRFEATVAKYESLHRNYFADIFQRFKDDIMKGYEFDSWLIDNDVRVVFGSENPEASHKGYIGISDVYKAAKECVKKAKVKDDQIIIYPQIFLLHLYRVFASLRNDDKYSEMFNSQEVKDGIYQQMQILENDLKTGSAGESNIKANNLQFPAGLGQHADPSEALKAMMNDPMLDNIFSMVTNTFASSGMIPKEELDKVSVTDIRKQFNNILNSDTLKKTFDTMNRSLSTAKTPEEAMKMSMGMMNDPNLLAEFAKASAPTNPQQENVE